MLVAYRLLVVSHLCIFSLLLCSVSFVLYIFLFSSALFYFPASGQPAVTRVVPSPPRFLPSIFVAHRVQHSHCSSVFPGQSSVTTFDLGNFSCGSYTPWECVGLFGWEPAVSGTPPARTNHQGNVRDLVVGGSRPPRGFPVFLAPKNAS